MDVPPSLRGCSHRLLSDHKILHGPEANHLTCHSSWDNFPAQFQMQNNTPEKQRESFKLALTYLLKTPESQWSEACINKQRKCSFACYFWICVKKNLQYVLSLSVKTSFVILFLLRTILLSWDLSPMGNEWSDLQSPIHILCKIP